MKIRKTTGIILFLFTVLQFQLVAQDLSPVQSWDFSEIKNRTTIESQSGIADTLEGNFS